MQSFKLYNQLNNITENQYLYIIETIDFNELHEGKVKDSVNSIKGYFSKVYQDIYDTLKELAIEIGMDVANLREMIITMFKDKTFFSMFKVFKFSFKLLKDTLLGITGLLRDGLLGFFKDVHKLKIIKKLESGLMTVDEVLDQYPVLSRVKGIAIAGLLFVGWVNMTFIGDTKYDFDWHDTWNSLKGHSSLADTLASPKGLTFISLVALGASTGIGFAWLGLGGNVVFAVVYTAYSHLPESMKYKKLLIKIRKKIKK